MHHRKDALFHFAGVLRPYTHTQHTLVRCRDTEDDHLALCKGNVNARWTGHAGGVAVRGEFPGIQDGKVRLAKVLELGIGGADEHVVHEEGVVCPRTHNPDQLRY